MEISSASSSNRPHMICDVFLSFRGEDTRHTFTGFLYEALHQLGIITFMDDKKLEIGDKLSARLLKAIKESRSSIVILSQDYASSKWCLRELAKIIDCMGTTNRVLPVFYHVDPSDVRNQSGAFKKSFDEHQVTPENFTDKQKEEHSKEIQNWRDAMTKIGNLSGVVVTKHSPEVDVVKKITNQIFNTWRPKLVAPNESFVGMKAPLQHMNVLLGVGLDDIRFVGIVGTGGIGKTSIAKVIYDCIKSKFEGSCILRISKHSSVVSLQQQLLSRILLKEDIRILDEDFGVEMIRNQLSGRKVLVVLDGVEEKSQLQMLAGSLEWFGAGSRVMITTRNRDSLKLRSNKDKIVEYHVKLLDAGSAQRLFCKHAFGVDYPLHNFMDLSDKIITKVNRLPLALKVIGSYLFEKNQKIWEETSERLLKVDEKYLIDILKISYDGLEVESQMVFLDLACFFNGERKDRVIQILDSFQYSPYIEIQLLVERCLIEVFDKKIWMHDLIQEMGQEIVRSESLTHPGKRTRIWLKKDVHYVFSVKHGLKYTQGIVLNLEEQEELTLEAKSFADMSSLRILQICNVHLTEDIKCLSNILGLLNWPGFPSKCLPSNFQSPYLFELHLPRSSIQHLWEGKKNFDDLKVIDVSDSKYLLETPDFSNVPKLERLVLRNCRKLCHVHSSISRLDHLVLLDLTDCSSFRGFSSSMRCKSLDTLILSRSGLDYFPEFEVNMKHLTRLYLNQTFIKELHYSIRYLTALVVLELSECTILSSLPIEIGNLRSLEILLMNGCKSLDTIPTSLGSVELLQYLDISETAITHAPSGIHCLKNLRQLRCEKLSRSFWHSLLPPYSIPRSNSKVFGLKLFSYSFGLASLTTLNLRACNLVDEDIPKDLHCFSSLNRLDLSKNNFRQLPESINHLKNLRVLILDGCIQLQHLPKLPANLVIHASDGESQMRINKLRKHHYFENVECILEKRSRLRRFVEMSVSNGNQFHTTRSFELIELFDEIKDGNQIEIQHDRETSADNESIHVYGVALLVHMQYLKSADRENISFPSFSFDLEVVLEFDIFPNAIAVQVTHSLKQSSDVSVLYIPFGMLPKFYLPTQNSFCFKATIQSSVEFVKVEKCGGFVLSQQNAPQFLPKMFTLLHGDHKKIYEISRGSSNHKREYNSEDLENVEDYCSSPTAESMADAEPSESDPVSLLKRSLKSNLRRTLEEVKCDTPFQFFPLGEISGWFRIQQSKDTVEIELPKDLHRNKKWMGLASFAVFALRESFEHIDSLSKYSFSYRIEPDGMIGSFTPPIFQIPLNLLNGSNHMLFVVFIPRDWLCYEANELEHVCIRFITNVAFVQVEVCGARLVYQQNVEGLIHTVVDCALRSGEDLYEFYNSMTLKYLLSSFHERMYRIRKEFPSVEEVPIDQPTAASTSSEKSIQEGYESKFDVILEGSKIPGLFSSESTGNEGTIRLPERWEGVVGFIGCALVEVKEQIGKDEIVQKPESCLRVLDLICELEVDSVEVTPIHCHFVSEEKLLRQYTPQFIWLFYTPRTAIDVLWYLCNDLKMKLSTSNAEQFHVQQCGLHLVLKKEMKMIGNLLQLQGQVESMRHLRHLL